jgi:mycoredoxin
MSRMTTPTEPTQPVTVYGRPACPMVPPVLKALEAAGVPYDYIDIRQDLDARVRVQAINHGNESVPTLVFPDGSTLTEPGLGALRKKLSELGYGGEALESVAARVGFTLRNPAFLFLLLAAAALLATIWFGG